MIRLFSLQTVRLHGFLLTLIFGNFKKSGSQQPIKSGPKYFPNKLTFFFFNKQWIDFLNDLSLEQIYNLSLTQSGDGQTLPITLH